MWWENWLPLTPTLSHQGRGRNAVGKLVAHLTSPIKGGEGDEE